MSQSLEKPWSNFESIPQFMALSGYALMGRGMGRVRFGLEHLILGPQRLMVLYAVLIVIQCNDRS